jgi:hypothetical protein
MIDQIGSKWIKEDHTGSDRIRQDQTGIDRIRQVLMQEILTDGMAFCLFDHQNKTKNIIAHY